MSSIDHERRHRFPYPLIPRRADDSQTQWVLIAWSSASRSATSFPDGPSAKGFHATDLQVLSNMFLRMIKSLDRAAAVRARSSSASPATATT